MATRGRWHMQIFVGGTEMATRGRWHMQIFVPGFYRVFENVFKTKWRPGGDGTCIYSSQVFIVFSRVFSKIDFSPGPARPFFSPPFFQVTKFFFDFSGKFCFLVTSSNVSLDFHVLIERGARARAHTHVNPLPTQPARFFRGNPFPRFWTDP